MVEADLGDESYGARGADGADNGGFGAAADGKGNPDFQAYIQNVEAKYNQILTSENNDVNEELICVYCHIYTAKTRNTLSQHVSRHHRQEHMAQNRKWKKMDDL